MEELKTARMMGRLVLSKSSHGSGQWLKLELPQALVHGLFATLNETGIEIPEGLAHCTVMTSDEVERVGAKNISENGKSFPFRMASVKHVRPSGWDEMSRVWFMVIHSPELKKLRASYGLSYLPFGHQFHITFAVRRKGVLAPNMSVTKQAFVGRDLLMPAVGGLVGAGLGHMSDRKYKKEDSWLKRHIGALLGMGGGALAGAGVNSMLNTVKQPKPLAPPTNPELGAMIPENLSYKPTGAEQRLAARGGKPVSIPAVSSAAPPTNPELGAMIPENLSYKPTGAEQRLAARGGKPLDIPNAPTAADIADVAGMWRRYAPAVGAGTAVAPMVGALSAVRHGLPGMVARGYSWGPGFDLPMAGMAYGGSAAAKLTKDLGASDITQLGESAVGATAGLGAGNVASKSLLELAKPIARRFFPRVAVGLRAVKPFMPAVGRVALPLQAAVTGLDAAYGAGKRVLQPQEALHDYQTDQSRIVDEISRLGTVKALARHLGRSILSPSLSVNSLGR